MTDYNQQYKNNKNVFGAEPEKILQDYYSTINKSKPVLDIGAGQGRHTFFLARKGYVLDAIDTSSVSIEFLKNEARLNHWNIRPFQKNFMDFTPPTKSYSAILIFGLIQILKCSELKALISKINEWIETGSLLFITAFSTLDASFKMYANNWQAGEQNSFKDANGNVRTFLEPGEISTLFNAYSTIHHWEGLGPKHHHGDGKLEQHAIIEAVFVK